MASGSKKVIYAALAGNSLIAITKFIAASITGSSAMLSEAIHSLVDTGNQVLLLYGMKRAAKPADKRFPFGHGKEIYFWSFVVAILIFALGGGISVYEGIHHLLYPQPASSPFINYLVLALAMIFEGVAWFFALREFRKSKGRNDYIDAINQTKDPSVIVVLFEDSAAMLGLFVAFIGVTLSHLTGNVYYDGTASILIGLILIGTAIWLARETKSLLIGESADPLIVQAIQQMVEDNAIVEGINEVLTMHMGPDFILVALGADFVDSASATEIEEQVEILNRQIKAKFPRVKRVFIEAEKLVTKKRTVTL
ncbi:cation diffusion facilitator family transporter [Desulfuromusa kysingii]|uniref:Cation diffusion facilitator family transporter n=1 Tax=Desulfuromusa kysingii TaxID=37625 RepID=A0A1H4ANL0_9BACT|nr:cation diffusion facilitator family transporter [Desulfuromusa kysingii]SEA37312.1 cation diffusion facilitator family transporter [Desulfuromusa kysingii]